MNRKKHLRSLTISTLALLTLLCLLTPLSAFAATVPSVAAQAPSGLISWWSGNGNANDPVGGNNGVLNAPAVYASGYSGQAFAFNGAGSVGIPDKSSLRPAQYSISLWFNWNKANVASPPPEFLIGKGVSHYEIHLGGIGVNGIRFIPAGYPATTTDALNAFATAGWHHLAAIYGGTAAYIYVDGVLKGSRTNIATSDYLGADTTPLYLGMRSSGDYPYNGAIDEVLLFNRALSADEVTALYNGKTASIITTPSVTPANTSATVKGVVNGNGADTTVTIEYGATTAYGSSVATTPATAPANSGPTAVTATITGLYPSTTYHFRIKTVNTSGATYGPDQTATTSWQIAAPMSWWQTEHTATLLPNGKVLMTSWIAELYDPATGAWSATGAIATARDSHTATLLSNGKVLVAGGWANSYLSSAELYDPATGAWSATGAMATARYWHTATLLPNGKVLVTGGYNGGSLSSAELYDPATGVWSPTGAMATARKSHTATLLPNGKVLVTGGYNGSDNTSLGGSELYDPATGAWSATGAMAAARDSHTATLLPNGKVLVTGGLGRDYILASAELYDPATGAWSATGAMTTQREYHAATLLPNGKVLVSGGYNGSDLASVELYNPATGVWSATGSLTDARSDHTATLLANGRVLVTGGYGGSNSALSSVELYDPATGVWSATGAMTTARESHTATLLPNGKVLVTGGSGGGYLSSAELYDPAIGAWSVTGAMTTARFQHTATLLPNGRVLVTGGTNGYNSYLSGAELYDPAIGAWSVTGAMATTRFRHTATLLPNGKVLVTGGYGSSGYPSSAELYDPTTGAWNTTGAMATRRELHTATLLPNGKVLVTGGRGNYNGILAGAELYDPATGAWSATGSLKTARYLHTATLLPNGKVLVTGGSDSSNGSLSSAELYDPATGVWSATGVMTTARYGHTATLLPNGRVLVTGGYGGNYLSGAELYDPAAGAWGPTGALATVREGHAATLLLNYKVLVTGGYTGGSDLNSAELYDSGFGFLDSWRPAMKYVSPLTLANEMSVIGNSLTGISGTEAADGGGNNSATNYPLAQLRSLDSSQTAWLEMNQFSSSGYVSQPIKNFPAGPAQLTLFVNGIPSLSRYVNVQKQQVTPVVSGTSQIYSGAAAPVTVTGLPAGVTSTTTYNGGATPPTAPGTYTVVTTVNDPVYGGAYYGTLVISKAASTTNITSAPTPSTAGSPVTIAYTVTSSSGTPTGTVIISDGVSACSGTVAAGNCAITFRAAGVTTLTATYSGDANFNGSASTGVSHTTTALPPAVTLTPATLNFGAINVSGGNAAQSATLGNNGGSSLDNISIPAKAGDFAVSHNCPASLAAGASCTITVTFTPSATGSRNTPLNITSSAAGSPHSVSLTGTGVIVASSVVVDPSAPATLYAGLNGGGVYRSADGGASWSPAATQPVNLRVRALILKPGDGAKQYAATYGGGIFASTDSGDHWSACANTGLANLNVVSLVIDAAGKLYAGTEAGVFSSSDNCATWTALNSGLPQ